MQSGKYRSAAPYLLIGFSLGAFVALEIAQRLVVAGEKVALLALLNSYPEKNNLSLAQHMLLIFSPNKEPCEGYD